jgi:hypothetical protein
MNSQLRDIAPGATAVFVATVFLLPVLGGSERKVQRVAVSGRVLIDGEPLTKGSIRFVAASSRPASSQISPDGSFRVAARSLSAGGAEAVGLLPGSYRIAVSSAEALGEAEDAGVRWLVPRRYRDFRTSGLEADIQAPNESMIVELTWEGAPKTNAETNTGTGEEETPILE